MARYPIPVPAQTREAFWAHQGKAPQNAGLIFERFAPDTQDDSKLKEEGLKATLEASQKADRALLAAWNVRWERLARAAGAEPFTLQTDWRLIAGLGKKGSLEVGFTFHRYGFPCLPGSSLKGLARAAALLEIGEKIGKPALETLRQNVIETDKPKEPEKIGLLKALETVLSRPEEETCLKELAACQSQPSQEIENLARTFRVIFGTTEHGGHVIFFDAIPSDRALPRLELDIMNPHYPDYYKETGQDNPVIPPANWQNPNPVKFLTVAPGVVFRFAVGWRKAPIDVTPLEALPTEEARKAWSWFKGAMAPAPRGPSPLLEQARRWLESGLRHLGAGGKTNAGYGYFTEEGQQAAGSAAEAPQKTALPPGYERGVVRAFGLGEKRSFGFITRSNGEELFVHRNNLRPRLTTLQAGQRVIFKVERGARGPQAMDVYLEE